MACDPRLIPRAKSEDSHDVCGCDGGDETSVEGAFLNMMVVLSDPYAAREGASHLLEAAA